MKFPMNRRHQWDVHIGIWNKSSSRKEAISVLTNNLTVRSHDQFQKGKDIKTDSSSEFSFEPKTRDENDIQTESLVKSPSKELNGKLPWVFKYLLGLGLGTRMTCKKKCFSNLKEYYMLIKFPETTPEWKQAVPEELHVLLSISATPLPSSYNGSLPPCQRDVEIQVISFSIIYHRKCKSSSQLTINCWRVRDSRRKLNCLTLSSRSSVNVEM